MEVQIRTAAADDVAPGERRDGIVVVVSGQKYGVGLGVIDNIFCRGDLVAGEQLVAVLGKAGGYFAAKREHGSMGADKECKRKKHALRCRTPDLSEPTGQRVGTDKAAECIGDVQKLVVVVFVRLENEQLAQDENKNRARECRALLARNAEESNRRQNENKPDILDPEPEPGLLSVIYPVDHDTDEVFISFDRGERPEEELRQRQQHSRKTKPEPAKEPFAGKAVAHG